MECKTIGNRKGVDEVSLKGRMVQLLLLDLYVEPLKIHHILGSIPMKSAM